MENITLESIERDYGESYAKRADALMRKNKEMDARAALREVIREDRIAVGVEDERLMESRTTRDPE